MPDAVPCECLPTQVCSNNKLQSDRDPEEDEEDVDEFPETISDSLWRSWANAFVPGVRPVDALPNSYDNYFFFTVNNRQFQSAPWW